MFTSRVGPRLKAFARELVPALKILQQRGIIGAKEVQDIVKNLVSVQKAARELGTREQRVFRDRLREDFGNEIEAKILESVSLSPDAIRFVPAFTLRKRLRAQENDVLDIVDTQVEALKRLRYSGYIDEKEYNAKRAMLESLPKLRTELLELLERHGDA